MYHVMSVAAGGKMNYPFDFSSSFATEALAPNININLNINLFSVLLLFPDALRLNFPMPVER